MYQSAYIEAEDTKQQPNKRAAQTYGPQFTVQSKAEIREQKLLRKEHKKAMKSQNRTSGEGLLPRVI